MKSKKTLLAERLLQSLLEVGPDDQHPLETGKVGEFMDQLSHLFKDKKLLDGAGRAISPNHSAIKAALLGDTSIVSYGDDPEWADVQIAYDEEYHEVEIFFNNREINNLMRYEEEDIDKAVSRFLFEIRAG